MDLQSVLTSLVLLSLLGPIMAQNQTGNLTIRPWLRICAGGKGKSIVLDGGSCPGGYMFTKPFSSTCVCANGIWILKSGYCDTAPKTFVLFADGNNCFNVRGEFNWIRYIGHPERARLDSHYIVSEYWDYLEMLAASSPSSYLGCNSVWSMATGDAPENIYLSQERVCFRSDWRPLGNNPNVTGNPYVRIGLMASDPNQLQTDPHQAQRLSYCPYFAKEESTHWFFPGGMLEASVSGSVYHPMPTSDVHGNCHERCTNAPPWTDEPVTTEKPPVEPKVDENGMPYYPWSGEDSFAKQMEELVPLNDTFNSSNPVCKTDPESSREMDLQTLRMIRTQTAFALKQVKSPAVQMREFQYLRKARQITAQKCPELSESLLKGFIRMFRLALSESIDNHPYREAGMNGSHERIMTALNSCVNGTGGPERNMTFVYNDTACPPLLTGLEYTPEGEDKPRNCSGRIPRHLRFKNCDLDYVMEATWKVILFTHYFCARHFINVTQDVSEFYVTMERLYSPDLLMRYYNPGNSYKGMQFAFQMYDLEKFMTNLERCVACSRDISQYRAWLKRPKNLKMCPMNGPGQSQNEYNFDIGGYKGIRRNPKYLPYKQIKGREYQCYSAWHDGLYTRPRVPVKQTCGLGLHVIGQTVNFA